MTTHEELLADFDRLSETALAVKAERDALRNELAAVKAASRHRFTASEVESCIDHALGGRGLDGPMNYEELARALNELMQNEEDYKDVLPELLAACKLTIGFCVAFREDVPDWQRFPQVGVLFSKVTAAIQKAEANRVL